MQCNLSTLEPPEYIPPVTPSNSANPVSPYAPVAQSVSIILVSPYTRRRSVLCQVDWWWWWETDFPATPCMVHVIQLALDAFMSNLGVNAGPNPGKPMSVISNLERMKAYALGRVKSFET